jgi:hypothetical protein
MNKKFKVELLGEAIDFVESLDWKIKREKNPLQCKKSTNSKRPGIIQKT